MTCLNQDIFFSCYSSTFLADLYWSWGENNVHMKLQLQYDPLFCPAAHLDSIWASGTLQLIEQVGGVHTQISG
jgi:hypothetical protein